MNPELRTVFQKVIAIHLTNYFPKNGIIKTKFFTAPKTWFIDTIHFTLNQPLYDLKTGTDQEGLNWDSLKFAVLVPFGKLYDIAGKGLQCFGREDTFFAGNITLPPDSIIIVFNEGLDDVINEEITSQREIASFAGKRQNSFSKTLEGIEYFFILKLGEEEINKIEIIKEIITQKGYKDFSLNSSDISSKLGLNAGKHFDHWSAELDFLYLFS